MNRKIIGAFIFLICLGMLLLAQYHVRQHMIAGVYFHGIPSETMMQTLSIEDLKNTPIRSLWNLHIQPPLYDLIRALLAIPVDGSDTLHLQYRVDMGIYFVWAIAYGAMAAIIYLWLSKTTGVIFSAIAACLFMASPPAILYATLLETTFLSALLILFFVFLLFKISRSEIVSPWLLSAAFLALFFTRSIFQWPWIFVVIFCLALLRYPAGQAKRFFVLTGVIVLLYLLKQFMMFGITSTSSFTGLNLCQSIQACQPHVVKKISDIENSQIPSVLSREKS